VAAARTAAGAAVGGSKRAASHLEASVTSVHVTPPGLLPESFSSPVMSPDAQLASVILTGAHQSVPLRSRVLPMPDLGSIPVGSIPVASGVATRSQQPQHGADPITVDTVGASPFASASDTTAACSAAASPSSAAASPSSAGGPTGAGAEGATSASPPPKRTLTDYWKR
jgi:hypothetical protein